LCQFNKAVNGLLKQENRVYDDKAAKLALEEAAAVSQEAEAFELLRRELAVLETRVRRSAGRANADMLWRVFAGPFELIFKCCLSFSICLYWFRKVSFIWNLLLFFH
jgi:hypothetical protein